LTGSAQPTIAPEAALTEVAATIFAGLAQTAAAATPTPIPPLPTNTPDLRPTQTPLITDTPSVTETLMTPSPTVFVSTPSPTIMLSENFFKDDFEHGKGWAETEQSTFSMTYTGNGYLISVKMITGDSPVFSIRSFNYADLVIQVEIIRDDGPSDNYFGVVCRFVDGQNYYRFVVGRDGYYNIGKKVDGTFTDLSSGKNPDAYKQGDATNVIRGECVEDTLALYLNGTKLTEVQDKSITAGKVGLVVGTLSDKGADIEFDNFELFQPAQ
jgi:hypothetical protein